MKGQHGHHRSRPNPAAAAAGSPDLGPACLPMPKRSRELVPLHQVGPSSVLSVASQDGTLRYVPPKVTVDEVLLQEELRADELKRRAVFRTMVVLMILAGLAVVIVVAFGSDGQFEWEELFGMRQLKMRSFLHISDASADPLYDYRYYDASSSSSLPGGSGLARDPALAKTCPFDSESAVLARWNRTGDATCPCGFFGADPPFSLLASLRQAITEAKPEFVAWSGGFAAPGLPGSAAAAASSSSSHSTDILSAAACATTKATIKAAIAAVSAQGVRVEGSNGATGGIANVYTWSASDVVPAGAPLSQAWLEDLGVFLLERNWLKRHEMDDWNRGGFYLRNLGDGLCVIVLNSLGWTAGHVNEHHAAAQLDWFKHDVWRRDTSCERFLVHAGVPLDATSEVNKVRQLWRAGSGERGGTKARIGRRRAGKGVRLARASSSSLSLVCLWCVDVFEGLQSRMCAVLTPASRFFVLVLLFSVFNRGLGRSFPLAPYCLPFSGGSLSARAANAPQADCRGAVRAHDAVQSRAA